MDDRAAVVSTGKVGICILLHRIEAGFIITEIAGIILLYKLRRKARMRSIPSLA